jgi:Sigma-70, region 4
VVQLQGCLGRVPRLERRVLVLRAGVGIAHTRSRAQVARITGIRRARVARLERRGLRKLRALGRAGACPVVSTGAEQTTTIAAPAVGGPLARRGEPTGRGGVLGESKSGGDQPAKRSSGANSEQSAVLPIARPESGPGGGGSPMDLTIIIVPVALATFAFVLFRELRRQT